MNKRFSLIGEFLSELWGDLNWFGKLFMFPIALTVLPLLILFCLMTKKDKL